MAYHRQATQANGDTLCPPRLRCSILLTIVTDLRIIFPSIPLLLPIGWVYPDAAGIWPGIRHNLRTMKPGRRVERETWIRCSQPLPAPCCGAEYSCCKHRRRCTDGHVMRTGNTLIASGTVNVPRSMAVSVDGSSQCLAFGWREHVRFCLGCIFQVFLHIFHGTHAADGNAYFGNVPQVVQGHSASGLWIPVEASASFMLCGRLARKPVRTGFITASPMPLAAAYFGPSTPASYS